MKRLTIKDWFQEKVAREMGVKNFGFQPVAISKETEKAYYMTTIYCTMGGSWHQKSMWVPKSCTEQGDKEVRIVETYEEASEIAKHEIAMAA